MKAKNLMIALAASVFALASCKPEAKTTEESVSGGADKVAEGISEMVEAGATAVKETAVEATEATEAVEATGAELGAAAGGVVEAPAVEAPAVEAPATPAE